MENFIAAIILLTVIIVFTTVNSFIISDICDDIISYIDAGDIKNACELWNNKKGYLALFIRDAEIDVVAAEANALNSQIPFEDGEAEAGKLRLRDAVLELKNSETPKFENIF